MILTETYERQKLYAFAADFLADRGAKNVLDIACGDGEGSSTLFQKVPSIVGVDIEGALIRSAEEKFSREGLVFRVGDARKTDFPDAHFDGIVSSHTLEHFGMEDQILFLREMRRIVKPEGVVIISTPDRIVWHFQGIAGTQKDHIRELSRREAEALFRETGFAVQRVFGQELLRHGGLQLRQFLNFVKKVDVLKIRRLFSDRVIARIDEGTQPVVLTGEVKELRPGDLSSILVFVCSPSEAKNERFM
ncbi:MAG: methyltransferase domain-containing protein [Candidatus Liptonbacteria bacterium]|nr:methyltransferase domain-containing protein [Parcubacteria group bacterium]MBI4087319.1 methyltransferase domain-containing protein [Candidatus Liptonbacteria bacterium]